MLRTHCEFLSLKMDIIKTCFSNLKSANNAIFKLKCPDNYDMESIIVNKESLYRIVGDRPGAAAYLPSYGTDRWLDDVVRFHTNFCIKKMGYTGIFFEHVVYKKLATYSVFSVIWTFIIWIQIA